jgi:anti-sigma factor ChrR (cupin superfamily)
VTAHWLYKEPDGGALAVLLRYEPGARVAEHEHVGYEQILVLKGDEYDEHGAYRAGSFAINPPGSRHVREGRALRGRGIVRSDVRRDEADSR